MEYLETISTQWTQMDIAQDKGIKFFADFLAAKYFAFIIKKAKSQIGITTEVAHEIASDVMWELLKNDYRMMRQLERGKSLRGLLATITKRQIIKRFRQKSKRKQVHVDFESLVKKEQDNLQDCIRNDVNEMLEALKEEKLHLYEVFYLHYFSELKVKQISKNLSLDESTVKVRLHRARRWIAERFEKREKNEKNR